MASAPDFQAKRASPLTRLAGARQALTIDIAGGGFKPTQVCRGAARQLIAAPVNARAAAAISPSRSALSFAPALRTAPKTSGGALAGVPASKGGSGAYSSASWIF